MYLVQIHASELSDACLKAHNDYRALHQDTPAMTYDEDIGKQAQEYADKLAKDYESKGSGLVHADSEDRPNQGENLYMSSTTSEKEWDKADASVKGTKAWYDEIEYYDYATQKTTNSEKAIGHFTQLIWTTSTKLGVGVATAKRGQWNTVFVVCRYSPPGNYIGKYAEHVKPKKEGEPQSTEAPKIPETTAAEPDPTKAPEEQKPTEAEKPEPTKAPEEPKGTEAEKPEPTKAPEEPKGTEAEKPEPTKAPEEPKGTEGPERPKPTKADYPDEKLEIKLDSDSAHVINVVLSSFIQSFHKHFIKPMMVQS